MASIDLEVLFDIAVQPGRSGNSAHSDYRPVDAAEALELKGSTGLDLAGFVHSVDESAIRHILAGHGERAVRRGGGPPITRQDVLRIPEITASPDAVTVGRTRQGLKAVRYAKRVNGIILYVEEVRSGRRKLTAKTMWKTKAGGAAGSGVARTSETFLPRRQAPRATDQATPPVSIIGASGPKVKVATAETAQENAHDPG